MGLMRQRGARRRERRPRRLPYPSTAHIGCGAGAEDAEVDVGQLLWVEAETRDMLPFTAGFAVEMD